MKEKMICMSPLQCAYMLNRETGACHVYLEFQGKQIREEWLRVAWKRLFTVHPILSGKCDEYGMIHMSETLDEERIASSFHLIREDIESREQFRERVQQRIIPLEEELACHLYLGIAEDGKNWIGFELDLTLCDVQSFQILLRDLGTFYEEKKKGVFMERKRDVSFSKVSKITKEQRIRDRQYWGVRLQTQKVEDWKGTTKDAQYRAVSEKLSVEEWEKIQTVAMEMDCKADEFMLLELCWVLLKEQEQKELLVNVPLFSREKEYQDSVGDFTGSMIFKAELEKEDWNSFMEKHRGLYQEDLSHCAMDGLEVQRMIKKQSGGKFPVPFVFSPSVEEAFPSTSCLEQFGELCYLISQTPGVQVDAQAYRSREGLLLQWIYINEGKKEQEVAHLLKKYKDELLYRISSVLKAGKRN